MRPLNLTPPEDRRGDAAPLRAGVVSYAIVGGLALALVAIAAIVLTTNKINEDKSELASLQARQAAAQQAAAGLAPYDEFATLAASRNQTVSDLARSRFDWERVLQELALVIPADVTLENLSGSATAAAAASGTAATSAGITGPSLDIAGCATGQEGVARMLAALRDIDGVTRVGMQSSTLTETETGPDAVAAEGASACERDGAAKFAVTVAFDAVPVAVPATTDTGAVPASTDTTAAAPTDGGVAETQAEQSEATDSAENQTDEARNAADTTGANR